MEKCTFPGGVIVKPDGVNELDPCIYQLKEVYKNVTVEVYECKVCGHTEIAWRKQENTEEVDVDDGFEDIGYGEE